jgi:hypothetical protein
MKKLILVGLLFVLCLTTFSTPVLGKQAVCVYHTATQKILTETTQQEWAGWVSRLSGAEPINLDNQMLTIKTRYSPYLFNGNKDARAFDYVYNQLRAWDTGGQIEIQNYRTSFDSRSWKNLIFTLKGTLPNDQQKTIIFSAHLDSITSNHNYSQAPGAEDNASGSAALLEAARVLRNYRFDNTIKLIWFTGEEQGLLGSQAYVDTYDLSKVKAVINMDMFGYDSDNDRCFEIYADPAGYSLPQTAGQCLTESIHNYSLDLTYDYLTYYMDASDHSPFWDSGISAVEVLENYENDGLTGGCHSSDMNPFYHTASDTINKMNLSSGFDIARAGLASVVDLAVPGGECFSTPPQLSANETSDYPKLSWEMLPGSSSTLIERSSDQVNWSTIAITSSSVWYDAHIEEGSLYYYRISAIDNGRCLSRPSDVKSVLAHLPPLKYYFLPVINN